MPRERADRRSDGGFTLIELLTTIVVLSVLAGIAVLGVAQFRSDSVSASCKADKKIVVTAANAFDLQQGSFPTELSDLEAAGYVKDPPSGVTYKFDGPTKTVNQGPCTLGE